MIARLLKMLGVLAASVAAGVLLLAAVYCLPVEPMVKNVERSVQLYTFEEVYPQWSTGYKFTQLDNCTDAYMLLLAIAPRDKGPLRDAMSSPYVVTGRDQQWQDLTDYSQGIAKEVKIAYYERYWGGYLVLLKPLLLFFEVSDIRVINAYIQFILIILMAFMIAGRLGKRMVLPYVLLMLVLSPISLGMSFQFSTAFYTMMAAMFAMLLMRDDQTSFRYCIFFEVVGIVTVYVDFLTYPVITLGVPLALYIALHTDEFVRIKDSLIRLIGYSLSWLFGYGTMWACKWVCATLILNRDIIGNAVSQAGMHTSETEWFGEKITRIGAVIKTLMVLAKWPYLLIGAAFLVILAAIALKNRGSGKTPDAALIFSYAAVSLYPVLWIAVLFGHSFRCYWYSYRNWGVTAFALGCLCVTLVEGYGAKDRRSGSK